MRRYITELLATGIKLPSFRHALKQCTIFFGDNAEGKTARADAIRVALMGYHPELGNTAGATFGLCCGARMESTLILSDGSSLSRSWEKKKDSVSSKTVRSPEDFPDTPPVLLNAALYLDMSETKRVNYIASLKDLSDSKWTGESICKAVQKIEFEDPTQSKVAALLDIAKELDDSDTERHEAEQSVQDWLEAMVAKMRDDLKSARASVDRQAKFIQAQTQLQAADTYVAAPNVDAELAECTRDLLEYSTKLQQLLDTQAQHKTRADRVQFIRQSIQELPGLAFRIAELQREIQDQEKGTREYVSTVPATSVAVNQAEAECRSIETELHNLRLLKQRSDQKAHLQQLIAGMPDHSAAISGLDARIDEIDTAVRDYVSPTNDLLRAAADHDSKLQVLKSDQAHLRDKLDQAQAMIQQEDSLQCPCCGQSGAKCQAAGRRIARWKAEIDGWNAAILADDTAIGLMACHIVENERKLAAARQTDQEIKYKTNLLFQLRKDRASLVREQEIRQQRQASLAGYGDIVDNLDQQVADLEARLQAQTQTLAKARESKRLAEAYDNSYRQYLEVLGRDRATMQGLLAKESGLKQLEAELAGMGVVEAVDQGRIDSLATSVQMLERKRDHLTTQQKRHTAAMQEALRREQSKEALIAAESRVEALKAVVAKLEEVQAELVQEVFGGLLAIINQVTSGLVKSPVAYHRGEIGRWNGSSWVCHKYFSGTEKLLTMAGVSAALAADAPIRVIIMDELGRLTDLNRSLLVNAMLKLIESDVIDQFIGCDAIAPVKASGSDAVVIPHVYQEFATHERVALLPV